MEVLLQEKRAEVPEQYDRRVRENPPQARLSTHVVNSHLLGDRLDSWREAAIELSDDYKCGL